MRKNFLFYALLTIGVLLPLTVFAQDSSGSKQNPQPNDGHGNIPQELIMLNEQGTKAIDDGDLAKAEALYQTLLQIHDYDVFWFQLAQIYTRQNRCVEANDAFSHIPKAKVFDDEPSKLTPEIVSKAFNSLSELCSAKVVFNCPPEETILYLDTIRFKCSNKPVPMVPGKHSVAAKSQQGHSKIEFEAKAQTETKVDIEVKTVDP